MHTRTHTHRRGDDAECGLNRWRSLPLNFLLMINIIGCNFKDNMWNSTGFHFHLRESRNEIPGLCDTGWFLSSSLLAREFWSLIKLSVLQTQTPADAVNDQVHPITAGTETIAGQHQPETDNKHPNTTKHITLHFSLEFHKPSHRKMLSLRGCLVLVADVFPEIDQEK